MTSTSSTISVHVRLFASYREAAGTRSFEVPLQAGATVATLVDLVAARVPAVRSAPGLLAVNHAYVPSEHVLRQGDEVAFIPPVSGGD